MAKQGIGSTNFSLEALVKGPRGSQGADTAAYGSIRNSMDTKNSRGAMDAML